VNGAPRLPDLAALSGEQKDRLIIDLWQTVQALDGAAPTAVPGTVTARRDLSALRARIGGTAASRRAWTPRRCGAATSRWLLVLPLVIGVGFLADFAVGRYQQRSLEASNRAALELENAAFNGLDAELLRVVYEPDGATYRAVMAMHNTYPGTTLHIMLNPVRVFVQVGQSWQEQPARAATEAGWGVVALTGDRDYQAVFQVEANDWRELIPGYMHVRIDSDMLISRRAEPGSDIVERNNRFYVYLKPQNADDAAIKRRSHFAGTPPVFIPMPPH
jgi:hypothetical protein